MAIITPSATNATLRTRAGTFWHRIIANDASRAGQGADWLARTGAKKVFVLDDLSAYGKGVADSGRAS